MSGTALCVLSGNLMDAVVGHVTLLGGDLKVAGIMGGGRMEAVLFSLLPSTSFFAVYVWKTISSFLKTAVKSA